MPATLWKSVCWSNWPIIHLWRCCHAYSHQLFLQILFTLKSGTSKDIITCLRQVFSQFELLKPSCPTMELHSSQMSSQVFSVSLESSIKSLGKQSSYATMRNRLCPLWHLLITYNLNQCHSILLAFWWPNNANRTISFVSLTSENCCVTMQPSILISTYTAMLNWFHSRLVTLCSHTTDGVTGFKCQAKSFMQQAKLSGSLTHHPGKESTTNSTSCHPLTMALTTPIVNNAV